MWHRHMLIPCCHVQHVFVVENFTSHPQPPNAGLGCHAQSQALRPDSPTSCCQKCACALLFLSWGSSGRNLTLCDVQSHTGLHERIVMWCTVSHRPSWLYCYVMWCKVSHRTSWMYSYVMCNLTPAFMNVLMCDVKSHTALHECMVMWCNSHRLHECIVMCCRVSRRPSWMYWYVM